MKVRLKIGTTQDKLNWLLWVMLVVPGFSLLRSGLNPKPYTLISGFRRELDEICTLLGYYTALKGSPVPTFRDNLSVPSSMVKKTKKKIVRNYHSTLRNIPEESRSQSQDSLCEIYGRRCDTGRCFSPSTSVSTCQYHSTNAPYSCFFCHRRNISSAIKIVFR